MQALPKSLCELELELFKSVVGAEPEAPAALRSTLAGFGHRASDRREWIHNLILLSARVLSTQYTTNAQPPGDDYYFHAKTDPTGYEVRNVL